MQPGRRAAMQRGAHPALRRGALSERPCPVLSRPLHKLQAVRQTDASSTLVPPAKAPAKSHPDASTKVDTVAPDSVTPPPRRFVTPDLPAGFAQLSQSQVSNSVVCTSTGQFLTPLEATICRLYYFSDEQKAIIQDLVNSMRNSRSALTFLAIANVLLSVVNASEVSPGPFGGAAPATLLFGGITVGDVAYWADSLMVAALINYASRPFERVLCSRSNQMAYTFQGLNRLSLVFQQLSIGSAAVSVVTGLEAAAEYPPVVIWASGTFVGLAVLRSAAMWWTLTRHAQNNEEVSKTLLMMREPSGAGKDMSLLDRMATFLAFGYLLQYEQKGSSPEPSLAVASPSPAPQSPYPHTPSPTLNPPTHTDTPSPTPAPPTHTDIASTSQNLTHSAAVGLASASNGNGLQPSHSLTVSNGPQDSTSVATVSHGAAYSSSNSASGSSIGQSATSTHLAAASLTSSATVSHPATSQAAASTASTAAAITASTAAASTASTVPPLVSTSAPTTTVSSTAAEPEPAPKQDKPAYEFSEFEERVLRGLTETASTAGLAMGLQAFMTFILAAADCGIYNYPSALGNFENGVNKAIMTYLLFSACSSYDRALHTAGTDVEHLMDGLGKKGLTGLFYSLAVLSWTIAVAQVLTLALPWITESLLAKAAGDGMSTRVAEGIIKSLQWVRAILRGL